LKFEGTEAHERNLAFLSPRVHGEREASVGSGPNMLLVYEDAHLDTLLIQHLSGAVGLFLVKRFPFSHGVPFLSF